MSLDAGPVPITAVMGQEPRPPALLLVLSPPQHGSCLHKCLPPAPACCPSPPNQWGSGRAVPLGAVVARACTSMLNTRAAAICASCQRAAALGFLASCQLASAGQGWGASPLPRIRLPALAGCTQRCHGCFLAESSVHRVTCMDPSLGTRLPSRESCWRGPRAGSGEVANPIPQAPDGDAASLTWGGSPTRKAQILPQCSQFKIPMLQHPRRQPCSLLEPAVPLFSLNVTPILTNPPLVPPLTILIPPSFGQALAQWRSAID